MVDALDLAAAAKRFGYRVTLAQVATQAARRAPAAARADLCQALVVIALEEKDRDLAAGLGADGAALVPIRESTRLQRRSAMGLADPDAPPLIPAWGLSRTRSLLVGEPAPGLDGADFWWLWDPHVNAPWGEILDYHRQGAGRLPVRDVFGCGPACLKRIRTRLGTWWGQYRKGTAPALVRQAPEPPASPPPFAWAPVPAYQPKYPALATPRNRARVSQLNVNGHVYTFGASTGGRASAAGLKRGIANKSFSGFHRWDPATGQLLGTPAPAPAPAPATPRLGAARPSRPGRTRPAARPAPPPGPPPPVPAIPSPAAAPPPAPPPRLAFDPARREYRDQVDRLDRDPTQQRKLAELARRHGMTVDEYTVAAAEAMRTVLSHAEPYLNIREDRFELVLQSGRFKSQFETGTSEGVLSPTTRSRVEETVFGVDPAIADAERPIYGSFGAPGFRTAHRGGAHGYGREVTVRFKSEVKSRATFTVGDSLNRSDDLVGSTPQAPDHRSFPYQDQVWRPGAIDPVGVTRQHGGDTDEVLGKLADSFSYVEAQYYNGVSVDDIAEVQFGIEPSDAIKAELARRSIPWHVRP